MGPFPKGPFPNLTRIQNLQIKIAFWEEFSMGPFLNLGCGIRRSRLADFLTSMLQCGFARPGSALTQPITLGADISFFYAHFTPRKRLSFRAFLD